MHQRKVHARYKKLQAARKTASAAALSHRARRNGSDALPPFSSDAAGFLVVQAVIRIQRNCRMRLARLERRRRIRDRVMGRVVTRRQHSDPPRGVAFLAILREEQERTGADNASTAEPKEVQEEAAGQPEKAPSSVVHGSGWGADIVPVAAERPVTAEQQPESHGSLRAALPTLPLRPASERGSRPRHATTHPLPPRPASERGSRPRRATTNPAPATARDARSAAPAWRPSSRMEAMRDGARRCCPTSRLMAVDRIAPNLMELRPHSACTRGPQYSEGMMRGLGVRSPHDLPVTPVRASPLQPPQRWLDKRLMQALLDEPVRRTAWVPAAETHPRSRARQPRTPPLRLPTGRMGATLSPRATSFICTAQSYASYRDWDRDWDWSSPNTMPTSGSDDGPDSFSLGSRSALCYEPSPIV